jgi:hypothetical protein
MIGQPAVLTEISRRESRLSPLRGWSHAGETVLAAGVLLRVAHIAWRFDTDWEPDGYQHVIFAQSVFVDMPVSLRLGINVWAKPLYTFVVGLYDAVLPAALPRIPATQLLNTAFWLAAMGLVLAIVRANHRHWATPIAVAVAGAFSYVFFRDSVTANTEPMGAAVMALGLWLWQRDRRQWALLAFGLLGLVRLDALVVGAVFCASEMLRTVREGVPRSFRRAIVGVCAFVMPFALWNVAGYLDTGSRLYVLTHGYSSVRGNFGYGRPLHFVSEFLIFDPVLFAFGCAGAALLASGRRPIDRVLVPVAVASALHFVILSAMWVYGIASAGLLRYFVFAYPGYLLLAARSFDATFQYVERRTRSLVPVGLALLVMLGVAQLHWLVRRPQWRHGLVTALVPNTLRRLPRIVHLNQTAVLYADRPEVKYYLHRTVPPGVGLLDRVRDRSARGIFVFVEGWSDFYSGVKKEDFEGLEQLTGAVSPEGTPVLVFRR